jgi:hypothetical protein
MKTEEINSVVDAMFTHSVPVGEQVQCMLGILNDWRGKSENQSSVEYIDAILIRLFEICEPEQVIL